jgi:hypothetical protein
VKPKNIPVSKTTLLKRFRRAGHKLRKHDGAYYLVSAQRGLRIELEAYGRRSGVLKPWETVSEWP